MIYRHPLKEGKVILSHISLRNAHQPGQVSLSHKLNKVHLDHQSTEFKVQGSDLQHKLKSMGDHYRIAVSNPLN